MLREFFYPLHPKPGMIVSTKKIAIFSGEWILNLRIDSWAMFSIRKNAFHFV